MSTFTDLLRGRAKLGDPTRHGSLTVYPLLARREPTVPHVLLDEALARGLVEVTEVDAGGSVPRLRVRNRGDRPVLIVEGTELRGGKQNRVANATVLVPAGVEAALPATCIERGRWHGTSQRFESGQVTDYTLRGRMRATVTDSTITGRGYASNQREVWDAGDQTLTSLGTAPPATARPTPHASALAR